jgi:hypothetical protein
VVDGTVQNVSEGRSEEPQSSVSNGNVDTVSQAFTKFLRKSARQCCHETGFLKPVFITFFWPEKWKPQKMDRTKRKCGVSNPVS